MIGGLLSLPFLGFGAGFVLMGVDATAHRWASPGKSRYNFYATPTRTRDITRLYGPGAILSGVSLCLGGLLVIPSLASKFASECVRPRMPAFDAA